MFYEIILEGIKKFAGEIIGVVLLIIALKKIRRLRSLFGEYKILTEDGGKSIQSKSPAMSDKDFMNLCKTGNVSEVKEAIKNGANVNAKYYGVTALTGAIQGSPELAELLLANGADTDINAKDNFGYTALMSAASKGYTELTGLLIKHGADVNAQDCYGYTALFYAVNNGCSKIIELLINHGADVNVQDKKGNTALKFAVTKERTEIANLLRSHGAKE